jgi:hypothetical protein
MGTTTKTSYDVDFVEWTARTAELIRSGRLDEVDLEHVAEEVEDLGKSERAAVASQLYRMLLRLVKKRIQPERYGNSWRRSISGGQFQLRRRIKDSPSLRRFAEEELQEIYGDAVKGALTETNLKSQAGELDIPEQCPYSLHDLLEGDVGP